MLKRHSQIIVSHIEELVSEVNLDNLIPELVAHHVFTHDMVNRILVTAGGNARDQARALFTQVPKRGPQAFSGLVSALLKSGHDNLGHLLLRMDGTDHNHPLPPYPRDSPDSSLANHNCWYSHTTTPFTLPAYLEKELRGVFPLDSTANSDPELVIDLQLGPWTPTEVVHAEKEQTANDPSAVPYYRMMSKPRGFALIINNIDFEHMPVRNGAGNDQLALRDMMEKLYFTVESHTNKTKNEMVEIVENFAAKEEWSTVDCCWVVLMSHGQEGESEEDTEIVGTDGFGLKTRDVLSYFYNDNCPRLRNKPKFFIFQSCRGSLTDPGVKINVHGPLNGYSYHHRTETDGRPQDRHVIYDRSRSDMFIAYPVPPGMKANRDKFTGAWFIQAIVWVFSKFSHKHDLEDLLKLVDSRIRKMIIPKDPNHQTVSTRTIGWSKKLFFNPGLFYQNGQLMKEIQETEEGVDVVDNKARNGKISDETALTRNDEDSDNEGKQCCYSCHP